MNNWSTGSLRRQYLMVLLLLSFATSAQVHAAISEFIPVQPVVIEGNGYDLIPPYGPGLLTGYIQVRDGFGGYNAVPGIDGVNTLNFTVGGINTPITRIEVVLAIAHPHINDLTVELISPSGRSVTLLSRLSRSDIPVKTNPAVTLYYGSIGGSFGAFPFIGMAPVFILSEVDPDDESGVNIKYINDVTALDSTPASNTYMNTLPAATYFSQGDLRAFNGLSGTGSPTNPANLTPANGTWRLKIVDSTQNNFITRTDGSTAYVYYYQGVTAAQLIITQEGGYKVWTGAVSNNWNDAGNWDPTYGRPSYFGINSILFPAGAAQFAPVNNVVETLPNPPARMRIAEISTNGPTPYTVDLGNTITFYKRTHLTNYGGNHTVTINTDADSQAGRLKLDALSGQLTINGNINGAIALKKIGAETVILNGASGYTGNTIVQEGILQLGNAGSLGNTGATAYTVIRNTGQIRVGGLGEIAEPLWLENTGTVHQTLNITGNQVWRGQIKFIPVSGYDFASSLQVNAGMTLTVRNFDRTAPDLYHWLLTGGGTVLLEQQLPLPVLPAVTTTGLIPTGTMVSVIGSPGVPTTFQISSPQINNIGNIILQDGNVTGTGALTPNSLGTFAKSGGLVASSGTSSITNDMTISGTDTGVNVTGGTLSMSGVIAGSVSKRGGGTLELNGASGTLPVTVEVGTLGGSGTVGAVSVARQGGISPTGVFTTTTTTFADQSNFIVDSNADQLVGTTVNLNGVAGVGGPILQVYDGVTAFPKTIITATTSALGTFDGMPVGTSGITYNPGTVVLNASTESGLTVWFDPSSYVVNEAAGTVMVTAIWSGGPGTAFLRNYGGTARRGRDLNFNLTDAGTAGTAPFSRQYTIPILQNYIQSGDTSTTLALVPQNGARLRSAPPSPGGPVASLLILDDDKDETNACGFGTGLTVFFLLGFGFLWQLRLRRR